MNNTEILKGKKNESAKGTDIPLMLSVNGIKRTDTDFFIYDKYHSPFAAAYVENNFFVLPSFGVTYKIDRSTLAVFEEDADGNVKESEKITAGVRSATEDEIRDALSRPSYVPLWWKEAETAKEKEGGR